MCQTMSKDKLQINLGPRWAMFTYERDDMELLGTVQSGMQIGALARLPDGGYAQVNGDIQQSLNQSRVEHALRAAAGGARRGGMPAVHHQHTHPYQRPPAAPAVVTVKKKRRIVLPTR